MVTQDRILTRPGKGSPGKSSQRDVIADFKYTVQHLSYSTEAVSVC